MATDFTGLASEQTNTARARFGVAMPSSVLPAGVPVTPAHFAWDVSRFWLRAIRIVDKAAEELPGSGTGAIGGRDTQAAWRRDRDRFYDQLGKVFSIEDKLALTLDQSLPARYAGKHVDSRIAEKFWIETQRLAIACDSVMVLPGHLAIAWDAMIEAAKDLVPEIPDTWELFLVLGALVVLVVLAGGDS
jgi:hypothetical protein